MDLVKVLSCRFIRCMINILDLFYPPIYILAVICRYCAGIILLSGFSLFMVFSESTTDSNLRSPLFVLLVLSLTTILVFFKTFVIKSRSYLIKIKTWSEGKLSEYKQNNL